MHAALLICLTMASATSVAQQPQVKVSNIRRVFHNGEHNAFTDLVRFQGRYYLTFRSCPDGHMVHPTSTIIILASEDLTEWKQVHRFGVPLRDTRDPHFLVFRNRLFVYTGTWYSGKTTLPRADYDLNKHLGYAAWSSDGKEWHSPIQLEGTFGHYIWKAATYDGRAYLCGRRKIGFSMQPRGEGHAVESAMLESDDGLIWRTRSMFQEVDGNETAFQFLHDGSILGIGRRRGTAQLLRSDRPWSKWERTELDRHIGGPLLARWGDRWVAGGRNHTKAGPRTTMYWLNEDRLTEFAELPSGGDNSYPGFLEVSPRRAVMSWYSSHEKDDAGKPITAIYMADLEIRPEAPPAELQALTSDKAVVLLVVGLSCQHCFEQVETFARALKASNTPLIVVTPEGLPAPNQVRGIKAKFISDPSHRWATWFDIPGFTDAGHATLVLNADKQCVWMKSGENPFMNVAAVNEVLEDL